MMLMRIRVRIQDHSIDSALANNSLMYKGKHRATLNCHASLCSCSTSLAVNNCVLIPKSEQINRFSIDCFLIFSKILINSLDLAAILH